MADFAFSQIPEAIRKLSKTKTKPQHEPKAPTKCTSDAIVQVNISERKKYVDKCTQTEEDRSYEDYKAHLQAQSVSSGFLPMYRISTERMGKGPPLKIGLSRPKGRPKKRKIFYPDEEPYYKPPAC